MCKGGLFFPSPLCGSPFLVDKGWCRKGQGEEVSLHRARRSVRGSVLQGRRGRCCSPSAGDAPSLVCWGGEPHADPPSPRGAVWGISVWSLSELWWKEADLPLLARPQGREVSPFSSQGRFTVNWPDPKESLMWPLSTNLFCGQASHGNLSGAFQILPS